MFPLHIVNLTEYEIKNLLRRLTAVDMYRTVNTVLIKVLSLPLS